MHGYDGLRVRRNPMFDVCGIEIERLVDFRENWKSAREEDGRITRVPCPGGKNHFVPGTYFKGIDSALQGCCAGRDGKGVPGSHALRELLLEGRHLHGLHLAVPPERALCVQYLVKLFALLIVV